MQRIRRPEPVKLICGIRAGDEDGLRRVAQLLTRKFGPAERTTDVVPAGSTYDDPGRTRRLLCFDRPIQVTDLPGIRLETDALEQRMAADLIGLDDAVCIGIDPGYFDGEKLVLASLRDRPHHIYLDQGVYAQLAFCRREGQWCPMPWTRSEWLNDSATAFWNAAREAIAQSCRAWNEAAEAAPRPPTDGRLE